MRINTWFKCSLTEIRLKEMPMMVWDYGYLKLRCVRLHNCRLSSLRAVFVIVIPSVDDFSIGKIDGGTVRRVEV